MNTSVFDNCRALFALILPYLAFILPFFFSFYKVSFCFLFLSFFSFLHFFTFSTFFSSSFNFLSHKWHRLILPPPPRGDGIFQYRDLCSTGQCCMDSNSLSLFLWYIEEDMALCHTVQEQFALNWPSSMYVCIHSLLQKHLRIYLPNDFFPSMKWNLPCYRREGHKTLHRWKFCR
jgi:hypothetical protein